MFVVMYFASFFFFISFICSVEKSLLFYSFKLRLYYCSFTLFSTLNGVFFFLLFIMCIVSYAMFWLGFYCFVFPNEYDFYNAFLLFLQMSLSLVSEWRAEPLFLDDHILSARERWKIEKSFGHIHSTRAREKLYK